MSDLYKNAEEFYSLVESVGTIKLAGRLSKKMIVKKLEKDRNDYNNLRLSVDEKEKSLKDLNEALDRDRKTMQSCRNDVLKAYDVLKNLDLLDLNEVKFVGDDVGYVKNRRLFRLELDKDGNISLSPFKKKKDQEDDEEEDMELSADDLMSSLIE